VIGRLWQREASVGRRTEDSVTVEKSLNWIDTQTPTSANGKGYLKLLNCFIFLCHAFGGAEKCRSFGGSAPRITRNGDWGCGGDKS